MGCVSGSRDCDSDEWPVHEVEVGSFALGRYEVTFEEYDRFVEATGRDQPDDEGWGRGRRPVIDVSWDDSAKYTEWLSAETGEPYRLPTESEWEYAARAGTSTAYSWGNEVGNDRANCYGCGSRWDDVRTAPVRSFGASAWGLHDVHGNVWEWVENCVYNYDGSRQYRLLWTPDTSSFSTGCDGVVVRGGSWNNRERDLRSANRSVRSSRLRYHNVGFRVARSLRTP